MCINNSQIIHYQNTVKMVIVSTEVNNFICGPEV